MTDSSRSGRILLKNSYLIECKATDSLLPMSGRTSYDEIEKSAQAAVARQPGFSDI